MCYHYIRLPLQVCSAEIQSVNTTIFGTNYTLPLNKKIDPMFFEETDLLDSKLINKRFN
jgi:hypothetical protein